MAWTKMIMLKIVSHRFLEMCKSQSNGIVALTDFLLRHIQSLREAVKPVFKS